LSPSTLSSFLPSTIRIPSRSYNSYNRDTDRYDGNAWEMQDFIADDDEVSYEESASDSTAKEDEEEREYDLHSRAINDGVVASVRSPRRKSHRLAKTQTSQDTPQAGSGVARRSLGNASPPQRKNRSRARRRTSSATTAEAATKKGAAQAMPPDSRAAARETCRASMAAAHGAAAMPLASSRRRVLSARLHSSSSESEIEAQVEGSGDGSQHCARRVTDEDDTSGDDVVRIEMPIKQTARVKTRAERRRRAPPASSSDDEAETTNEPTSSPRRHLKCQGMSVSPV